jgi:transposase-like protein
VENLKGDLAMRRRLSPEEKVAILREHLEKNVAVPDICEKYRIHPNQFYKWKKELFEKAAALFIGKTASRKEGEKVDKLERAIKNRNEVIAELLQENIKLKKSVGEI